ncbi:hypothetical protein Tco_0593528 [Tanacetum coccineum]
MNMGEDFKDFHSSISFMDEVINKKFMAYLLISGAWYLAPDVSKDRVRMDSSDSRVFPFREEWPNVWDVKYVYLSLGRALERLVMGKTLDGRGMSRRKIANKYGKYMGKTVYKYMDKTENI